MNRRRHGFTLLEIVISLAILSVSLMVLVESQSASVMQTVDSQRVLTANSLAEAKLAEVLLGLEMHGFTESDQGEEGSFESFGDDGSYGDVVDFEGEYDDYSYAWTIRQVDMEIGDIAGTMEDMQQSGLLPQQSDEQKSAQESSGMDPSMLSSFLSPDQLNDMLSPWMREVRVVVWWGDDPGDLEADTECDRCVELVTHVFNPSGKVFGNGASDESSDSSSSSTTSGGSSSGTGTGTSPKKGGSSKK